jgi:hypothetical protein
LSSLRQTWLAIRQFGSTIHYRIAPNVSFLVEKDKLAPGKGLQAIDDLRAAFITCKNGRAIHGVRPFSTET